MIIESLWITRKYDDSPPELLQAWDEISIDENPDGFREYCKEALDAVGDDVDMVRYIRINVPSDALEKVFMPAMVESEVLDYRGGIGGGTK